MLKLFDQMQLVSKKQLKKSTANSWDTLIFDLILMTQNNRSKLFANSGSSIAPDVINKMLSRGLIQSVISEDVEKYALTFRGIAESIQIRFGKGLEEQFLELIKLCDKRFNGTELAALTWKEKLVSLSLILIASTSESSEVHLDNDANKATMIEVFDKTLDSLKKHRVLQSNEEIKAPSSGEHPVTAIMRRVNDLSRKTNLYFVNDSKNASSYYFDIEENGTLNSAKFSFLLKRIFEKYDPECNYKEMYQELALISQLYTPKFRARMLNQTVSFGVLKELKNFTENDVMHLSYAVKLPES